MDERIFRLTLWTLGAVVILSGIDAALVSFELGPGFWGFVSGMLGLLTAVATIGIRRRNGNGGGKDE